MNELPIQKVLHYHLAKEKKNFKLTSSYAIMEKFDGWYVYLDILDGELEGFKSSSGRIIPSLNYLVPKLKNWLKNNYDYSARLIFEATIPGLKFHEINGILNRKYEPAENVVLNLHDMVSLLPDQAGISFTSRYNILEHNILPPLQDVLQNQVDIIPIREISQYENVFYSHFNDIISEGGEGIILKNIDAGYSFGKRNSDVMKIKEEITEDLEVIGLIEGEGKYRDTTGALKLIRTNGKEIYDYGMTDKERETWWENPSAIIGKYVEIKAMKELTDGTLREPRFKAVRYDK